MTVEVKRFGNGTLFKGGTGTNASDPIFTRTNFTGGETGDISEYDSFMLMSTTGAMAAYGSLDGANFATAPLSLTDMGAADATPVLVTAANRIYGFRGKFLAIKVLQSGATAVANGAVMCGVIGSRS